MSKNKNTHPFKEDEAWSVAGGALVSNEVDRLGAFIYAMAELYPEMTFAEAFEDFSEYSDAGVVHKAMVKMLLFGLSKDDFFNRKFIKNLKTPYKPADD